MGPTNVIKFLAQQGQSPWRGKSTPSGPRGLHPAGALVRTHRNLKKQKSRWEQLQAKSRQTLRESARTPPEARGLLSDTIKRGTLSKTQKDCLGPRKYQSQRTITGSRPILRLARSPRRNDSLPRRGPLAEALSCRGPTPQGLERVTDSLIRPRPRE